MDHNTYILITDWDNYPELVGSKKMILILNTFISLLMGGTIKTLFLESASMVLGLKETKTWVKSF